MATQVTILSPLDLKRGSVAPDGRVISLSTLYVSKGDVVVDVLFTDGSAAAFHYPSGSGWKVDGRTAP